jgi:hypothetical protein
LQENPFDGMVRWAEVNALPLHPNHYENSLLSCVDSAEALPIR